METNNTYTTYRISCTGATAIGSRYANQDAYCIDGSVFQNQNAEELLISTDKPRLFAVLDGMGGESDGGTASRTAALLLNKSFEKLTAEDMSNEALECWIRQTLDLLHDEVGTSLQHRGGTTVTGVILYRDSYTAFNIGDSPCYINKEEDILPLYKAHNVHQLKLDMGMVPLPGDESLLLCSIGMGTAPSAHVTISTGKLSQGCRILVASDGVTNCFSPDRLFTATAEELTDTAAGQPGSDNSTAISLYVT